MPPVSASTVAFLALLAPAACGSSSAPSPPPLDRAALLDSASCAGCHPDHYAEWSASMHAHASDDPVFLAMNARAQRQDAAGDLCVRCHAPMAVREGATQDGLNLAGVPQALKGVTCYFCHAIESVADTHNDPLALASDDRLFGPFADAASGTLHRAVYSPYLDSVRAESAAACGSCHDIVNRQQAHVERTYEEWGTTLFSSPPAGLTCAQCHMQGRAGQAAPGAPDTPQKTRRIHAHTFPGVDLSLTSAADADAQRPLAQQALDSVLQATVCYVRDTRQIVVNLDNVGAGHAWPSGATPDRRAWIELGAFSGGQLLYESGGAAALPLEGSPDPDLWLIRDCLFDGGGNELRMFWQASLLTSNQVPGAASSNVNDPTTFLASHVKKTYPAGAGASLPSAPDRITLKVHLQAIGDDVLQDLVASGDLDPSLPPLVARYELAGAAVEWTPGAATTSIDPDSSLTFQCVTTGTYRPTPNAALSHARCTLP